MFLLSPGCQDIPSFLTHLEQDTEGPRAGRHGTAKQRGRLEHGLPPVRLLAMLRIKRTRAQSLHSAHGALERQAKEGDTQVGIMMEDSGQSWPSWGFWVDVSQSVVLTLPLLKLISLTLIYFI